MFTPAPFDPARPGLLLPGRLDELGITGPTRSQSQGKHVRRTSRGFYLPAWVAPEPAAQRIVEASVVVPPGCAITGWAALHWYGARWFSGTAADGSLLPVTVAISTRDIRPQYGIEVSGEGLNPRCIEWVDGLPVTCATYATSFLMRYAPSLRHAVAYLDMAAYSDLVSIAEQRDFLTPGQNGWTGVPQARLAVELAAENAWSPQEVFMRLVWIIDAGLLRPLCNAPIFDLAGRHLATPDLIDPVTGVMGEYDGDGHLTRDQRHLDVKREGLLRGHGLESVIMLAPDLRDPRDYLRRLAEARRRATARPVAERTWTLEAPSWWTSTATVDQRRALTADQRRRFLGYRLVG
ncbi:hypothetical protein BH09ACT12_BH09ACT12_31270 [soil metagenome]